MNRSKCAIKLMVVIAERGSSDHIIGFLRSKEVLFNISFMGTGTAHKDKMSIFGLDESKKDIVFAVINEEMIKDILTALKEKFHLGEAGKGVAFTININSISSRRVLNYCLGNVED